MDSLDLNPDVREVIEANRRGATPACRQRRGCLMEVLGPRTTWPKEAV